MFFSFFMLGRKRTRKLTHLFYTSSPNAGIAKILSSIGAFLISAILFLPSAGMCEEPHLTVFCGAAFNKPFEEIVAKFHKERGIVVDITYSSVPSLYSQFVLGRKGDILMTPTPDLMARAASKGLILQGSVKGFTYLVPVLAVRKGNPLHIKGITDLARPGIRIAMADPGTVYIGDLAKEILETNFSSEELTKVRANTVAYVEDFSKLTLALILKHVDVIITFHYFHDCHPEKIDIIKLKPKEVKRVGAANIGIVVHAKNQSRPQQFVDFVMFSEGKGILKRYGFLTLPDEVCTYIGVRKPPQGREGILF